MRRKYHHHHPGFNHTETCQLTYQDRSLGQFMYQDGSLDHIIGAEVKLY